MKNKNTNTKDEKKAAQHIEDTSIMYKKTNSRLLFKFPDNSIYYGQIAYLDEYGNIIENIESVEHDHRDKIKLVRHGIGSQFFDLNEENGKFSSKYEGEFIKDKRTGKGKLTFSDGDFYEGAFMNNDFEGEGTYIWKGKDKYTGQWKDNRMEGKGIFYHREGMEFKGLFVCNYFVDEKGVYINPFTPKLMIDVFKKKSFDYFSSLPKTDGFSIQSISKVKLDKLNFQIEECFKNLNKAPFVIRSSK